MTAVLDTPVGAPPETARGPLADAQEQLRDATAVLGYDAGLTQVLASPRREITVSIPLRRDDGSVTVLTGHRVQHDLSRGPAKGGVRSSPHVDLEEVRALAMWMTWKCALMELAQEIEDRLAERMSRAWDQVLAESRCRSLTLRAAATVLAVQRVAEAHLQRGLYP